MSFIFFLFKKISAFSPCSQTALYSGKQNQQDKFHEAGRPLTFVGKYKYSGLNMVSKSSHGKSVRTVCTTVGHSAPL